MPEYIPDSRFEDELRAALDQSTETEDTVGDTEAAVIVPAVIAMSEAQKEVGGSLKMDFHLTMTTSNGSQWVRDFKAASPDTRAVMLSQVLDAFNDGQEGIELSFSEPEIT